MTHPTEALHIPDTQSARDERRLAIQRVGIKDVRYPLALRVAGRVHHTHALWDLDVALPSAEELAAAALPSRLHASCRSAYFRHRVLSDEELPPAANAFLREWLCQILISAAIARSVMPG